MAIAVGNPHTHKACFCDGSCRHTGICGGTRYPSENIQGINTNEDEVVYINKAQELKEKAKAAQKEREEAQRRNAQELYEKLLPEFEKAAEDGSTKYLVRDSLMRGCSLTAFNSILAKEGFVTTNTDGRDILVRWDNEPLFNIRR